MPACDAQTSKALKTEREETKRLKKALGQRASVSTHFAENARLKRQLQQKADELEQVKHVRPLVAVRSEETTRSKSATTQNRNTTPSQTATIVVRAKILRVEAQTVRCPVQGKDGEELQAWRRFWKNVEVNSTPRQLSLVRWLGREHRARWLWDY
jgi:hypothetical protein